MKFLLHHKIIRYAAVPAVFFLFFSSAFAQTDTAFYFNSFDGTKIYYEVKGKGKPVLLVHGFIVNSQSWKRTVLYNDLLNLGYKVIIPDLRGNGKSDKPHQPEAYENDAEAKDIMQLMKLLKIKRYTVVGYSRGSIIASRLLLLDKRVTAAALGGMGDGFTDANWPRRQMFYRALMNEPVKELEAMVKYVKDSGLDQLALAYLQKGQPSASPQELGKLKKPVLVICGDNDPDNGSPDSLAKMIPSAVLMKVPGDHSTTLRSVAFSSAVVSFLYEKNK